MHVLLLSMPDAFEHTPTIGMCMPNGALASLAGNIDPHHEVAIADLVLVPGDVAATVERLYESESRALGAACGAIVTSPFTARRIEAFGVPPRRIRVVEPGVDRMPLARGHGEVPTILCVASLVARKGHDVLLRALARLEERPWRLVCVGAVGLDPTHEARVRELARSQDLASLHQELFDAIDEGRPRSAERAARAIAAVEARPP